MSSNDPACRSFEFEFEAREPVPLKFRGIYAAPDRIAFVACDAHDGVPIAAGSLNNVAIYDPINGKLDYRSDIKIGFKFGLKDDEIKFGFGIADDENRGGRACVDVKSFAQIPAKRLVIRDGDERYKVVCLAERGENAEKNKCYFHVDMRSQDPFSRIEFITGGDEKPVLSITRLRVNGSINATDFEFPDKDKISKRIPIASDERIAARLMSSIDSFKGIAARDLARKKDGLGSSAKRIGLSAADLEAVRKNDALHAAALKELFANPRRSPKQLIRVLSSNEEEVRK